jgi:hypothetical protein
LLHFGVISFRSISSNDNTTNDNGNGNGGKSKGAAALSDPLITTQAGNQGTQGKKKTMKDNF